jgi:succinate dehydrogenase/fumarate reductase flavoprotein subunit
LKISENAEVLTNNKKIIAGFFAAGECSGGIHNKNRLAGNSLVDCVVYGRIAGSSAAQYVKNQLSNIFKYRKEVFSKFYNINFK